MFIDTMELDNPQDKPEEFMLLMMQYYSMPDTIRPKEARWIIPINFDKLDRIIDEL